MDGQNPNTHLAENRLSSDLCDWSEVTDGLLWDTWSHRDRDRVRNREEERRTLCWTEVSLILSFFFFYFILQKVKSGR